jgi:hypothetical protein
VKKRFGFGGIKGKKRGGGASIEVNGSMHVDIKRQKFQVIK